MYGQSSSWLNLWMMGGGGWEEKQMSCRLALKRFANYLQREQMAISYCLQFFKKNFSLLIKFLTEVNLKRCPPPVLSLLLMFQIHWTLRFSALTWGWGGGVPICNRKKDYPFNKYNQMRGIRSHIKGAWHLPQRIDSIFLIFLLLGLKSQLNKSSSCPVYYLNSPIFRLLCKWSVGQLISWKIQCAAHSD